MGVPTAVASRQSTSMSGSTMLGIVGSAVILVTLFEMMRRHRLREKYALIWALVALAIIIVAVFPVCCSAATERLGLAGARRTCCSSGRPS